MVPDHSAAKPINPFPHLNGPPRRDPRPDDVLPRRLFRQAVRAERLRCDRRDGQFALLLVRGTYNRGHRKGASAVRRIERALLRAARGGDVIGRYDATTAAVILLDSTAAGAMTLADRLSGGLLARKAELEFQVLAYGDPEEADRPPHLEAMLHHPTPLWKRAIDVAVAGSALVAAAPLMAVIAAAIKLGDRGPIVFTQQRAGLGGQAFKMYKFRTMVPNAEAMKDQLRAQSEQDGPAFKIKRDPRITTIGRILRKTSLDELPQLWNIVRGDMSLVGPRPLPLNEQAGCSRWQGARLDVAPGLTCYWQVEGRNTVSFDQWMRMDLRYMHHRGPLRDAKILLSTVPAVLGRKGGQ
jgi:lipopolysaccharide/colanic/teichoic acid biosynthesis glycosyltransferase